MPLQGSLEEFEITDILQVIYMSKKNGVLKIEHPSGEVAHIYVKNSRVVHAECGGESGDLVLTKIFGWDKGKFEFVTGEFKEEKSMDMPIPALIMEAARKIDEWNKIKKLIPSLELIFELEPNPDTDIEVINLNAEEWRVLSQIDGKKTIKEIAKNLNMGEIETAKIMFGLIGSGLIRKKVVKESEKKEEKKEKTEKKKDKGFLGFFKKGK